MTKVNTKILNYILLIAFAVYLVLGNLKGWSYLKSSELAPALTTDIFGLGFSIVIGVGMTSLLYYYLVKMRKPIYQVFLVISVILVIVFFVVPKQTIDYVLLVFAYLPIAICSYLILKYHHFPKKK